MRDRGPTPPGGRASAGAASYTAVGRRKRAVARVLLQPGPGNIIVNGLPLDQRFPRATHQAAITLPLRLTNRLGTVNVLARVIGGGTSGQAGAIIHATARALLKADETTKQTLREAGFLTRDAREKERKKYGLKAARRRPQYTKR
ncbi:MAG: 30S ribosomal protein S9 [Chloroflexi bacterium]|nr:30S ribosomal protein S9 [Chloroflexota bacterium]